MLSDLALILVIICIYIVGIFKCHLCKCFLCIYLSKHHWICVLQLTPPLDQPSSRTADSPMHIQSSHKPDSCRVGIFSSLSKHKNHKFNDPSSPCLNYSGWKQVSNAYDHRNGISYFGLFCPENEKMVLWDRAPDFCGHSPCLSLLLCHLPPMETDLAVWSTPRKCSESLGWLSR